MGGRRAPELGLGWPRPSQKGKKQSVGPQEGKGCGEQTARQTDSGEGGGGIPAWLPSWCLQDTNPRQEHFPSSPPTPSRWSHAEGLAPACPAASRVLPLGVLGGFGSVLVPAGLCLCSCCCQCKINS